jgi:hypothetical protein
MNESSAHRESTADVQRELRWNANQAVANARIGTVRAPIGGLPCTMSGR